MTLGTHLRPWIHVQFRGSDPLKDNFINVFTTKLSIVANGEFIRRKLKLTVFIFLFYFLSIMKKWKNVNPMELKVFILKLEGVLQLNFKNNFILWFINFLKLTWSSLKSCPVCEAAYFSNSNPWPYNLPAMIFGFVILLWDLDPALFWANFFSTFPERRPSDTMWHLSPTCPPTEPFARVDNTVDFNTSICLA